MSKFSRFHLLQRSCQWLIPGNICIHCNLNSFFGHQLINWVEGESKSQNHQEPRTKTLRDPSSFVQHHHKFNSQAKLNDDKLLNPSWHLSWTFTYGKIQQPHEQIWGWASRHKYSTTVTAGMISSTPNCSWNETPSAPKGESAPEINGNLWSLLLTRGRKYVPTLCSTQ